MVLGAPVLHRAELEQAQCRGVEARLQLALLQRDPQHPQNPVHQHPTVSDVTQHDNQYVESLGQTGPRKELDQAGCRQHCGVTIGDAEVIQANGALQPLKEIGDTLARQDNFVSGDFLDRVCSFPSTKNEVLRGNVEAVVCETVEVSIDTASQRPWEKTVLQIDEWSGWRRGFMDLNLCSGVQVSVPRVQSPFNLTQLAKLCRSVQVDMAGERTVLWTAA